MKRVHVISIVFLILGVAAWIFFIIAGNSASPEEAVFGDSFKSNRTSLVRTPLDQVNASIPSINETGPLGNISERELRVIDLGLNLSTEYLNLPGIVPAANENRTITRRMFLEEGIWGVFGHNLFSHEMALFLADKEVYHTGLERKVPYFQKINFPVNFSLQNFTNNNFRDGNATIGFSLGAKDPILVYDASFTTSLSLGGFVGQTISLMGQTYYIESADHSSKALSLLEGPYQFRIGMDEKVLVNYPIYESPVIEIISLEEDYVLLKLDETLTPPLDEGDSFDFHNLTIFIDELLFSPIRDGFVDIVVSSRRLLLQDNNWVYIDGVPEEDVYFEIYPSSATQVDGFRLLWEPRDEKFVTASSPIVFPVFETLTLSMSDWTYLDPDLGTDEYVNVFLSAELTELFKLSSSSPS